MEAYRIVDWWKFELLKNGKLATAKTKMVSLRIKPLIYVRFPVHGHVLSSDYRRMVKRAGPEMAAACDGVYKMLVGLAGNQVREYRGWILDDRQQPLNPGQVAELLCLSERKTSQVFEILTDDVVKWVNLEEFPEPLHKSLHTSDLPGGSHFKNSGKIWEKKGAPLIEAEAEVKEKDKLFEFETGEARAGKDAPGGDGGDAGQPQARPQPPASASDSAPVADSVSEKPSDSASASVPVSASVSGAGGGPGAEGSGPVSVQQRFEIIWECKKALLELTQIIPPRNRSDMTTINDIFSQLQHRLISGSPYPLLELSLNTARQCWRGDKPIAVFVAAMKKPPFYYVPKKLSVIPGKFSRVKKTK